MKASTLIDILRQVPNNSELYFLDSARECIALKAVEAEYPNDDDAEICINFALETNGE